MPQFASFDEVFQALKDHFRGDEARIHAVVAVHIPEAGRWYLHFQPGRLEVLREPPEEPVDVTLTVSAQDYWDLLYGRLDPLRAYMQGRLQVEGDRRLLYELQHLFRLPQEE